METFKEKTGKENGQETVRKPVLVITGYLGAGKTTVINALMKQEKRKLALIVNDMGSVNIDARVLEKDGGAEAEMVELQNGCICCTLREEFMKQVELVSRREDIEAVFVEASGISDPSSIAQGFLMYEELFPEMPFYLKSIVTVVDADRLYHEFMMESDSIDNDSDPDIINLVLDQIEFCNTILVTKCDLLSRDQMEKVKAAIRQIQREAPILECTQGNILLDQLLEQTQEFDYEKVMQSSLYQRTIQGGAMETEGFEEHGISSFLYESRGPFDRDKWMEFVEKDYPSNLIRGKGYLWFSDDDVHIQLFEQAGRNASVSEMSNWLAAFPEEERRKVLEEYPDAEDDWDPVYGDRFNQLVFIGKGYDRKALLERIEACLA